VKELATAASALGKGHQVLDRAAVTADPGEPGGEDPAPKAGLKLPLHEDGQPQALGVPVVWARKVWRWAPTVR
jgi:hypothetical protein